MSSNEDAPHRPPRNTGRVADESASDNDTRLSVVDIAFLVYIPVVLVVVFLLPMGLRRDLALIYTEPSLRSMYASHFVHFDLSHLVANLLVYLLVVPFSLAVSVWSGRRRRFYLVAFTILVAFPPVLSGLDILFQRPQIGMGFSGMNLAFVGFSGMNLAFVGYLPHVLAAYFDAERPEWKQTSSAFLPLAFFVGMAIVTVRVAGSLNGVSRIGFGWLFLAGAGSLLAAVGYTRTVASYLRSRGLTGGTVPPVVAFGSLLFVLLVIVGFPEVSPEGGSVTNLLLHLLGFSFGYIVPYVTFQVLEICLKKMAYVKESS